MKKLILGFAALAAFTACSNEELLSEAKKTPIAFSDAFVENTTRAIDNTYNTDNLIQFNVYGKVTGAGDYSGNQVNIFQGVSVEKATNSTPDAAAVIYNNTWWYPGANVQYWVEGASYDFAAIAGVADVDGKVLSGWVDVDAYGMPTAISYDAETQRDVLFVKNAQISNVTANYNAPVAFTFDHLLSKAHFTFKNTIPTNNASIYYQYKVKDLKISNVYQKGIYTTSNKNWEAITTGANATYVVNFGNISNADDNGDDASAVAVGKTNAEVDSATSTYSMLFIPNNYTNLTITGTLETLLNGKVIKSESIRYENFVHEFVAGHAYNFIISKGAPGEQIKFTVTKVNEWDTDHDNNKVDNDETPVPNRN